MGDNSIQEVRVNSGDYVDSIEVIYDNRVIAPTKPGDQNSAAGRHGGDGGSITSILRLEEGEYITRIGGRYGIYVDSLYFETNLGQTVITGSDGGALDFLYTVSEGSEIQGVFGLADEYVNAIGVIVRSTHNDVVCND